MLKSVNNLISIIYLTSNKRQTIVAMLGVTFGISMYIFMTGFMTGVNDAQTELAFSAIAHVKIYNDVPTNNTNLAAKQYPGVLVHLNHPKVIKYTDGIKNSYEILEYIKKQPEVEKYTSQVNINVFFKNAGNKVNGIISGVEVIQENKLFSISKYLIAGNWNGLLKNQEGMVIGGDLAKNLGLNENDNVSVLTADGVTKNYKIIGVFKTNVVGIDKSKAYINISSARQLLAVNPGYVTDIQVNVKNFKKTKELEHRLKSIVKYKVESWQTANQQLVAASFLRDIIAIAVSLTILLVAGFGIYNIMNMTINQKIKEIAILKAMGFSGKDVMQIFLTLAIVIGIFGGIVGICLGYAISAGVNSIPFEVAGLHTLPMAYNLREYLLAFSFGMMTTFIAGYLPARKASNIDPVNIIRG
jgi:lipoprotein-releasing system permease protein